VAELAGFVAPVGLASNQPQTATYIWNGHTYTQHPPKSLRLGRLRLTNITWKAAGPDSTWGWGGESFEALVWPSHWFRTSITVEQMDVCPGGQRQYVLSVGVLLPRHIPAEPWQSYGRQHLHRFALRVPVC
jgi:hypothetical protein